MDFGKSKWSGENHETIALIIDDTEVVRSLLTEALSDKGYNVKTACNASTGIELATQLRPALVFCDTYMPDLDGFETIKRIRQALPGTIVVMTNSLPTDSDEDTEGGADYLLNKPFGLDELWSVLDQVSEQLSKRR